MKVVSSHDSTNSRGPYTLIYCNTVFHSRNVAAGASITKKKYLTQNGMRNKKKTELHSPFCRKYDLNTKPHSALINRLFATALVPMFASH